MQRDRARNAKRGVVTPAREKIIGRIKQIQSLKVGEAKSRYDAIRASVVELGEDVAARLKVLDEVEAKVELINQVTTEISEQADRIEGKVDELPKDAEPIDVP
jgi:hypothetical protein